MTRQFHLTDSEFDKRRAYEIYAQLRETDPVCAEINGENRAWFITRYEDAVAVLHDHQNFIKNPNRIDNGKKQAGSSPLGLILGSQMLSQDPPEHTRLRKLVSRAFTPQVVANIEPYIEKVANDLVEQHIDSQYMELVEDFAFPLPATVIAELLGIPEIDHDRFHKWSATLVSPPKKSEQQAFLQTMKSFISYLNTIIKQRREQPGQDLLTALIQVEEEGEKLSQLELLSMVLLLLLAGHETVTNFITNSAYALVTHPQQLMTLKAHPEMMATAVEELLRYDGPLERASHRWAARDVIVGGKQILQGDLVTVILGSANRDQELFCQPDLLDLTRTNNRHLAFGHGIHYCLGAPLARAEARIALTALLTRLPPFKLAIPEEELQLKASPLMRGFINFPICWD